MAVATAPHRPASGVPSVKGIAAKAGRFLARIAKPVRAPLVNLASIPLHVAALGCLDAAPFQSSWHVALGLVVIAGSLVWLEHVIADEQ